MIKKWATDSQLTLNYSKCGILEMIKNKRQAQALKIGTEYRRMLIVEFYKYLGVWVDNRLNLKKHLEETTTKAIKSILMLRKLGPRKFKLITWINIFKIYIQPLFDYSAVAIETLASTKKGPMKALEAAQLRCLKYMLGLKITTSKKNARDPAEL